MEDAARTAPGRARHSRAERNFFPGRAGKKNGLDLVSRPLGRKRLCCSEQRKAAALEGGSILLSGGRKFSFHFFWRLCVVVVLCGKGKFVLKHTVSLKENRIFRRLYAKGKSAVSPTMVLYCRKNGQKESRLGLTVGTKLGCAVVRNRVRRRLREIYRLHEQELLPGYDIVVVARVRAVHSRYAVLERDFLRLAKKLQLLSPAGGQARREEEAKP